jgi:hypothetical protein
MEAGSIQNAVLGGFFMLVGVLMVIFHKQVREIDERRSQAFPEALTRLRPRGALLTVFIVVFGALSFFGGLSVLIVNFVEP